MSLTPDEIEAERERFEAWWQQRWALSGTDGIERDDDEYFDHPCEHAWTGWLAAIASERDRRKQQQDAAEALLAMQGWPEMKPMRENGE